MLKRRSESEEWVFELSHHSLHGAACTPPALCSFVPSFFVPSFFVLFLYFPFSQLQARESDGGGSMGLGVEQGGDLEAGKVSES